MLLERLNDETWWTETTWEQWEDNIKMDPNETERGSMEWLHFTDRVQWQDFVKMAMNLLAPYSAENERLKDSLFSNVSTASTQNLRHPVLWEYVQRFSSCYMHADRQPWRMYWRIFELLFAYKQSKSSWLGPKMNVPRISKMIVI
jgi:hypothetical protein